MNNETISKKNSVDEKFNRDKKIHLLKKTSILKNESFHFQKMSRHIKLFSSVTYLFNYMSYVRYYLLKLEEHIFKYFSDILFRTSDFFFPAGGGQFDPPSMEFFLHNSKSIGLRLLKFSDFSYITKALPLGLKPGFNTNCLSPQAHCLNDCFFM